GNGELHRHEGTVEVCERLLIWIEDAQFGLVEFAVGHQCVQHRSADNSPEEIIYDNILIVMTDEFLAILEAEILVLRHDAIVEAQEQALELRNDGVFVVPWIPDQGAPSPVAL